MDIKLTTQLGPLKLESPIIVGSCPMTANSQQCISMVDSGAGALVLPSLSAGEHRSTASVLDAQHQSVDQYLKLVERTADQQTVPIIASLNGSLSDAWHQLPKRIESAGAAAIELSLRMCGTAEMDSRGIDDEIVALSKLIHDEVKLPVFLKLTRKFTGISQLAGRLKPYVEGLVLFGRMPVVDIELDSMQLTTSWGLTQSGAVIENLESLIRTRESSPGISLAACGGIGNSVDLIKALIAGANAAMVTSALYRHGPGIIRNLKDGLIQFMSDRGVNTIAELHSFCPPLESVQFELETKDYQSTVDHEEQMDSVSCGNPIQSDRFGHPST